MAEQKMTADQKPGMDERKQRIVNVISSVVEKVGKNEHVSLNIILKELRELLLIIEEVRTDLGNAKPSEIKGHHIPGATDELSAIIQATSEATGTIMDSCDIIQEKAGEIGGDAADSITGEVMKIYEACSFQDITGQRVSKVITTFEVIETKVDKLLSVFGVKGDSGQWTDERQGDAALLNGPQMPDNAISQEDIDRLLAELDAAED